MGYPLTICSTQTHNVKIFGPGGLKRFFSTSQYFCRSHNFKLPWANPYKKKSTTSRLRGVPPKTCLPVQTLMALPSSLFCCQSICPFVNWAWSISDGYAVSVVILQFIHCSLASRHVSGMFWAYYKESGDLEGVLISLDRGIQMSLQTHSSLIWAALNEFEQWLGMVLAAQESKIYICWCSQMYGCCFNILPQIYPGLE